MNGKMREGLAKYRGAKARGWVASDWKAPVAINEDGFDVNLGECHAMLEECEGRMAQAARKLKVSLGRFQRAVQGNPVLLEVVMAHRELLVDEAEMAVRAAVREGDALVSLQVLRTVGKHRGWTDKEILLPSENKVQIEYVNDWRQGAIDVDVVDEPVEQPGEASADVEAVSEDLGSMPPVVDYEGIEAE